MMLSREVLVIVPVSDDALGRIATVDRCLRVVDARGRFDAEIRETWPPWTVERYMGPRAGFVLPSLVFLTVWAMAFHGRSLISAVIMSVALVAGTALLFRGLLGVLLPLWPGGGV
jgi:hypothetical protein